MNHPSKHLIRGALLVGLIVGLTGCIIIKVTVESPKSRPHPHHCQTPTPHPPPHQFPYEYADFEKPPPPGHVWGPYTRTDDPHNPGDPAGNSGTLIIPTTSFLGGGYTCFPSALGWDSYFIITNFILGPNAPEVPDCFTNKQGQGKFTARTCVSDNGTSLKTGIVIYNLDNPNGDKVCKTNAGTACLANNNLTINQRPIAISNYYRAVIYYQSSTLGGLTNVTVTWNY